MKMFKNVRKHLSEKVLTDQSCKDLTIKNSSKYKIKILFFDHYLYPSKITELPIP